MKELLGSLAALALMTSTVLGAGPYSPSDAERARWTMQDMRSWAICLKAHKIDHGQYPVASSMDELRKAVEPTYIAVAPMRDAWGTPFQGSSTAEAYQVVSAGSDGELSPDQWATAAKDIDFAADALIEQTGGMMLRRSWPQK